MASHALSFVANSMPDLSKLQELNVIPDFSQYVYVLGEYVLTRAAALTEAPSTDSHVIEVLPAGRNISVLEVLTIAEEGRSGVA